MIAKARVDDLAKTRREVIGERCVTDQGTCGTEGLKLGATIIDNWMGPAPHVLYLSTPITIFNALIN